MSSIPRDCFCHWLALGKTLNPLLPVTLSLLFRACCWGGVCLMARGSRIPVLFPVPPPEVSKSWCECKEA